MERANEKRKASIMKKYHFTAFILFLLSITTGSAQQDPQYTQYMYNTQVVNPAYAGTKEVFNIAALYRTQWVGFEGAPRTGTLSLNTPFGSLDNMGIGLSIVSEEIGPATESNVNIDYSYILDLSEKSKLSLGLKAGIDVLNVDFTKLNLYDDDDPRFQENIDSKLQPQIGAGVYYYTDNFYFGASVPNFIRSKHYDEGNASSTFDGNVAVERLHYFFITGYVFQLSENLKFKPATLVKVVSGSPLQWDMSANFLIRDKFTIGASYRWSAALSGMLGFQVTDGIFLGVGYDYQTTDLEDYSDGSYEFIVRFDIFNNPERAVAPRFF